MPAVEKQVPPPDEKEGPYSHAGKVYVAGKGLFTVPKLNAAGEAGIGYGVGKCVEIGALRVQSFVYNPDGNMIGVSGAPGLHVDVLDMLGFTVEVAVEYYFVLPTNYKSLLIFALAGAQVRFYERAMIECRIMVVITLHASGTADVAWKPSRGGFEDEQDA